MATGSRKVFLLGALLMALVMLSGLPTSAEVVLKYADTMSNAAARAGEADVLYKLLDLFEKKNPGIRVEIVWDSGNFDVQYLGGVSPDVARFTHEPLRRRARQNMLLPLDKFIARDKYHLDKFFPPVLVGFQEGGGVYGIPMYFGTLAAHYNKAMFSEVGLPYPNSDTWSWEKDFVQAGKKIARDITGDGAPDRWIATYHASNLLAPLMAARDAEFVSDDMKKWQGSSSTTIDTLQWLQDQIHVNKIVVNDKNDRQLFTAGTTAYQLFGSWGLAGMYQSLEFDWDLAEVPMSVTTGHRGTRWNADGWCISNQTKHPEEAWKLVQFIGSREAQEIIARAGLGIPPYADVAKKLFPDPTTPQDEWVFLRGVDYMWIDKRHELDTEARKVIEGALKAIVSGAKSARVAMEEISSTAISYL